MVVNRVQSGGCTGKWVSFRLRDYTGKWTEKTRLPTTSRLSRDNFRLARHLPRIRNRPGRERHRLITKVDSRYVRFSA